MNKNINYKTMKVKDIKKIKCTVLGSGSGFCDKLNQFYTQRDLTLNDILFVLGRKYYDNIKELRQLEYHSNEQREYKVHFPCWFVGGTFPMQRTSDNDIVTYSNILAIDIDACDNPEMDLETIREKIMQLPYVIGAFKSISGMGIYVLVLVEDGKNTKGYYTYLTKLWKYKFNINVDPACTNIGRKRFISYEDNIEKYIKSDDTEITEWKLIEVEQPKEEHKERITYPKYVNSSSYVEARTHLAMQKLVDAGYNADGFSNPYNAWYHVGCEFKNFPDGLDLFVKFSQNSCKWHDDYNTIRNEFEKCKASYIDEALHKKWQGMALKWFGQGWWKDTQQKLM